jgi:Spy/CpxP family protein refolding chaperone
MNRLLYSIGAGLLIVAGIVGVARGELRPQHPWFMHRGFWGPPPLEYVAHKLDLTAAQREQIKSICIAELPIVKPMLRQLLEENSQMPSSAGTFDETRTRELADRQAATISQLLVERQRLISKIYNDVLTPTQRVKADQLRYHLNDHLEHFLNR